MIYLMLSIALSSVINIIFRLLEGKKYDGDNIMFINYIWATALSMLLAAAKDEFRLLSRACMAQSSVSPLRESPGDAVLLMAVLGIANGAFLISHILAGRKNNFANGVGMGAVASKVSFLIPVGFGLLFWNHSMTPQQFAGVLLAFVGLYFLLGRCAERTRLGSPALLFAVFFISGLLSLNFEAFVIYADSARFTETYFSIAFASALLSCTFYLIWKRRKYGRRARVTLPELFGGSAVGVVNVVLNMLTIKCLQVLPSAVYYPTNAAGSLIVSVLSACVIFHERLTKNQILAVLATTASVILTNI